MAYIHNLKGLREGLKYSIGTIKSAMSIIDIMAEHRNLGLESIIDTQTMSCYLDQDRDSAMQLMANASSYLSNLSFEYQAEVDIASVYPLIQLGTDEAFARHWGSSTPYFCQLLAYGITGSSSSSANFRTYGLGYVAFYTQKPWKSSELAEQIGLSGFKAGDIVEITTNEVATSDSIALSGLYEIYSILPLSNHVLLRFANTASSNFVQSVDIIWTDDFKMTLKERVS